MLTTESQLHHDWRLGNEEQGIEGYQPQFEELFKEALAVNYSGHRGSVKIAK